MEFLEIVMSSFAAPFHKKKKNYIVQIMQALKDRLHGTINRIQFVAYTNRTQIVQCKHLKSYSVNT